MKNEPEWHSSCRHAACFIEDAGLLIWLDVSASSIGGVVESCMRERSALKPEVHLDAASIPKRLASHGHIRRRQDSRFSKIRKELTYNCSLMAPNP